MTEKIIINDFECEICGTKDKWQNIDEYRFKPHNMYICMNCGREEWVPIDSWIPQPGKFQFGWSDEEHIEESCPV